MKHQRTHLNQQQQEQTATSQQSAQQQSAREFSTVEEALRADSAQNPVPPAVAERIQQSIEREQIKPPARSWWQRLLGK